jgi:hypothetical protein
MKTKERQMKKLLFSLGLCVLVAVPVFSAAQQTKDSDVPDKAEVVRFLELMYAGSGQKGEKTVSCAADS